jgi:predicted MFS family arabinose efflux permease
VGTAHLVIRVLLPFAAAYFLSLFYRTINALIAPDLIADLSLAAEDLGLLTSMYFLTSALFQLPLGVLLDRFGARRVQAVLVLIAALGGALFAVGQSLLALALARALIGLGISGGLMAAFKMMVVWLPKERLPLGNGLFLAVGGMGVLAATTPAEFLLTFVDWRGLFLVISTATAAVAVWILLGVPEKPDENRDPVTLRRQVAELRDIYGSALFWRYAPVTVISFAIGTSLQGLWAGPWLRDVAGLGRDAVAAQLLAMAVALTVGSIAGGVISDVVRRFGLSVNHVVGGAAILLMLALAGLTLQWLPLRWLFWVVLALAYNSVTLSYAALSQHFPSAYAGRVNAGMNMLVVGFAFVVQYAIGAIIGLWPQTPAGGYPATAYSAAFGSALAIQVLSFVWFLWGARPQTSTEEPSR